MSRFHLITPFAALVVALSMLAGCSGGGSTAKPAPGGTGNTNPYPNAVNPISGTVTAADFSIPTGATQTAVADLTITGTNSVTIDGTLLVEPGVNVNIYSNGPITIDGTIDVATKSRTTGGRLPAGGDMNLLGSAIHANGWCGCSGNLNIAVTRADGTVYITGRYGAGSGANATVPNHVGENAPNINIGSVAVLSMFKGAGKSNAVAPQVVKITGQLTTFHGGWGYNDFQGIVSQNILYATGTNGGNGGNITIAATGSIDTTGGTLTTGEGGNGGEVGYVGHPVISADGATVGAAGQTCVATSGNGGIGGSITLNAPTVTNAGAENVGHGGYPGLMFAEAGNGGPGGNGGDLTLNVGIMGADGIGSKASAPYVPLPDMIPTITVSGSNGRQGAVSGQVGGNGGNITIVGTDGKAAFTTGTISLTNCANGGNGFDGSKTTPQTAGGNGGNAGKLVIHGAAYTITNAFNGGNCGNGNPSGNIGGNPGSDDAGKTIGYGGA